MARPHDTGNAVGEAGDFELRSARGRSTIASSTSRCHHTSNSAGRTPHQSDHQQHADTKSQTAHKSAAIERPRWPHARRNLRRFRRHLFQQRLRNFFPRSALFHDRRADARILRNARSSVTPAPPGRAAAERSQQVSPRAAPMRTSAAVPIMPRGPKSPQPPIQHPRPPRPPPPPLRRAPARRARDAAAAAAQRVEQVLKSRVHSVLIE